MHHMQPGLIQTIGLPCHSKCTCIAQPCYPSHHPFTKPELCCGPHTFCISCQRRLGRAAPQAVCFVCAATHLYGLMSCQVTRSSSFWDHCWQQQQILDLLCGPFSNANTEHITMLRCPFAVHVVQPVVWCLAYLGRHPNHTQHHLHLM
jgi:hypothetical protein